ncbi:MAG: hypothetical protein ACYTFG_14130, partial [Planctomycetota bacterium]
MVGKGRKMISARTRVGIVVILLGAFWTSGAWAGTIEERLEGVRRLEAEGKKLEAVKEWKALVLEVGVDPPETLQQVLNGADKYLRGLGNMEELESLFREASIRRPSDLATKAFLASIVDSGGKVAEAKALYLAIGDEPGPYAGWALQRLGIILVNKEKKLDEATAMVFVRALRHDPRSDLIPKYIDYLASLLLLELRDKEGAKRVWDALGTVEGFDPTRRAKAYLWAGMIDYQQGRHQEAADRYRKAIALAPHDAEMVNN